ncbi:MAG TPA: hypothetical protein VMU89_00635 [Thermomicrobiaceae bacterium]|nr:hypothetical protein [Thermomicrobiaceae bacterium]
MAQSFQRAPRRRLLLAVPLGLIAAVLLWFGDSHLAHRDWLLGGAAFGLGLAATLLAMRQLRLAGLVR